MTVAKTSTNIFKGTFPQLVAVLSGTLVALCDGMHYGWTSPILPYLYGPDTHIKTTKTEGEWLETSNMLGAFFGLWITMQLVDRIGRKYSIILASVVSLLVWIVIALAPRIEYIFVARVASGIVSNMAFVAAPMYIAEIAEQKIRGFLSSVIFIMMLFGIILIYTVTPFTAFYVHCIIGGAIVCIELCTFPFMPESPYFLFYKNKPEAAEKALRKLRAAEVDIKTELEDIKSAVERQKTERGKFIDIFVVPSNRKGLIIMAFLNFFQHFAGVSAILMNLHLILAAAGSVYIDSRLAAIIFSIVMAVSAIIGSFIVDKYGRTLLIISSSGLSGIWLLIIGVYFSLKNGGYDTVGISWIPIVCVMLYACCFKYGLGLVPIILTAELFPAKTKVYSMTIADGCYMVGSIISLQVYQQLENSLGLQYPFYVFSFFCFLTVLFTSFYIPETKGKTLEEIQIILKGKHVESDSKDKNTKL